MLRIRRPYNFLASETSTIELNVPVKGKDWDKSVFDNIKNNIRNFLLAQQKGICAYCETKILLENSFSYIEHIAFKNIHFRFMFESHNLVISCLRCNTCKGTKEVLCNPSIPTYPLSGDHFLIIHPYFDNPHDHVKKAVGESYIGKTDKGKKTILYLKLNREDLVLARAKNKMIKHQRNNLKKMALQLSQGDNPVIRQRLVEAILNKQF